MALQEYYVERIPFTDSVRKFLHQWHYADYHNVQHKETFGLYRPGVFLPELVGVCVYTRPAGPSAAKKYYPKDPDKCLELRRLCLIDHTPKNAESFFVSRTLKWLKKHTDWKYVISYADSEQGHRGTIYRAANFTYHGTTAISSKLEVDGKLFHIRTLSMLDRPYGVEINNRYKRKDPGVKIIKGKVKHIYTYSLDT
jgi:hypothetical protein